MDLIIDIFAWTLNFWGGHTGNTSKQQKIAATSEDFLSEDDFEAVLPLSHVTTMVLTFLRQLRRSLWIKKITNPPSINNSKKVGY